MGKNQTINLNGLMLEYRIPNIKTNLIAHLILNFRGYRDGKKNIPFLAENNNWISPTIRDEKAKVSSYMSKIYRIANTKNFNLFIMAEISIAKFEQNALQIERLHNFLKEKLLEYETAENIAMVNMKLTEEQKDFLNSKRVSETNLDPVGLRARRLNEYFRPLATLKEQINNVLIEIEQNYENLVGYYTKIEMIDETVKAQFFDVNARIDKRLSWYWQGVLRKHKDRDSIKIEGQKIDDFDVKSLYDEQRKNLESKFKKVKEKREKILNLSIV